MIFKIFVFVFVSACWAAKMKKFPAYIEKCHQTDAQLEKCLLQAIRTVKPHLKNGIPEFRLPKMDPLVLPEVGIDAGAGFIAKFENVQIYDADKFDISRFDVNLTANRIRFDLSFPHIRIQANYAIFGRVLFFNLDGSGPADGNITNCRVQATMTGQRYYREDRQYLRLTDTQIDRIDFGEPTFRFAELFRNNPELTEQTNRILNANMPALIDDLRPTLERTIAQTVMEFIGRVFAKFSVDELFPK